MKSPYQRSLTSPDEPEGLSGPYDGAEPEDPWFLPAEADDAGPAPFAPRSERRLFDPVDWRSAEAALAADLAALCHDAGRLAERLQAQAGGAERLALQEAASLSWWSGDRIGAERLGLWLALRLGATGDDAPGVARAAWAARRLAAPQLRAGGWSAVIGGHLGLSGDPSRAGNPSRAGDPSRAGQDRRDGAAADHLADAAEGLEAMAGLSPVTYGCLGFHLWRMADPAPPDGLPTDPRVREVEAAVLGARLAAGFGAGQGLLFLPLSLTGFSALTASGPAERLPRPLAAGLGAAGRSANRRQPRGGAAQPRSAGGARAGARSHRTGQVPGLGGSGVKGVKARPNPADRHFRLLSYGDRSAIMWSTSCGIPLDTVATSGA